MSLPDASIDSGARAIREGFVLGLDTGTRLGWAVLDAAGRRHRSDVFVMKTRAGDPGARWLDLAEFLDSALEHWAPELVAFEEVARQEVRGRPNFFAAHLYGGVVAHVLACCAARGVPSIVGVPSATVKSVATADGRAKKDDMRAAAGWRFGFQCADDNEADALWVAWCALLGRGHPVGLARSPRKQTSARRS